MINKLMTIFILTFSIHSFAQKEDLTEPIPKEDKERLRKDVNKRIKILAELKSCIKSGQSFNALKDCTDIYLAKIKKHNETSKIDKINELKYF